MFNAIEINYLKWIDSLYLKSWPLTSSPKKCELPGRGSGDREDLVLVRDIATCHQRNIDNQKRMETIWKHFFKIPVSNKEEVLYQGNSRVGV